MKNPLQDRWFGPLLHVVGVVTTLLVVGGFYGLVYWPLGAKRAEHCDRLAQIEMLLAQASTVQIEHGQLRKQLQGLQRTATETHQRLPALPLDREFVSEVRQVADRVGMEILDHRLSPQQKVATHSQTEVSFRCRGSYASICKFLSEIEQLARLTKVSKLELESDDYLDRYPFQVSFVLYYGLATNDTNERRAELSGDRL